MRRLEWHRLLSSIEHVKMFDLCKEFGRLSLDENENNTGESSSLSLSSSFPSSSSNPRCLVKFRVSYQVGWSPWNQSSITEQLKAPFIEFPRCYTDTLSSFHNKSWYSLRDLVFAFFQASLTS